MKKYKVGSLFAGVGGVCLGFMQANNKTAEYEVVWANEVDEHACETYRTNFKHTLLEGDITLITKPERVEIVLKELAVELEGIETLLKISSEKEISKLKKKKTDVTKKLNKLTIQKNERYYEKLHEKILSEEIDILNGGFPCQTFSIAGDQKGFEDQRGNLFLNIVELIHQLGEKHNKPRILLLENVKNLKSHDKGRTYEVIKEELEKTGYTIYETILNTMDFTDLPQNRERMYIVGFLNDEDAKEFSMFEKLEPYRVKKTSSEREADIKQIIDYDVSDHTFFYTKEKYPHYFVTEEEYDNGLKLVKEIRINLDEDIKEMYQFYQLRRGMYVRKNMSDVCPTLTANMGTGGHNVPLIKVSKGIRKITPKEAFGLQGFPIDNGYKFPEKYNGRSYPNSMLYKQAGNAVSVPVVKLIADQILEVLEIKKNSCI